MKDLSGVLNCGILRTIVAFNLGILGPDPDGVGASVAAHSIYGRRERRMAPFACSARVCAVVALIRPLSASWVSYWDTWLIGIVMRTMPSDAVKGFAVNQG